MTTIFERVDDALSSLSPAVAYAMDTYESTSALPDTFITYTVVIGTPEQHADDTETMRSYLVQVSIFARSGLVGLPDVDTAMIAQGFERSDERQIPKDQATGHYGLAKDYIYLEQE